MREVTPGLVWIGNARDARDVAGILAIEITAVVDLAMEEPPCHFPREIIYCRFPLLDGEGNSPSLLRTAVQTIASLIQSRTPTLVACSGGMSRSPALTAAALAHANRESADEWLRKIAATGPYGVAPALWNDLRQCVESDGLTMPGSAPPLSKP